MSIEIGDRVVCVKIDPEHELIVGRHYIIQDKWLLVFQFIRTQQKNVYAGLKQTQDFLMNSISIHPISAKSKSAKNIKSLSQKSLFKNLV